MAVIRKKSRYLDLDLNFTPHPTTGDIVKVKNEKAVIAAIGNLIQTNYYERLFRHEIGSDINKMLFEPIDLITSTNIKDSLERIINEFEPRANILALLVTPNEDEERYDISMSISINNLSDPFTINFFLERIR